jgi:retron-type reverse transcriptase
MFNTSVVNQTLFQRIVCVPSLYQAWRKVRANRGAAGVDAICLQAFESTLEANLCELSRSLQSGSYQPLPARYVVITKEDGRERELGILCVRDRVAQRSTLDAIENLFEPQFLDCNFAFRVGRSVEMAIQRMIAARANGFWWTVESDVQDFFGSIDRRLLLSELDRTIQDANVLGLIKAWLDAGALDEDNNFITSSSVWRHGKEAVAGMRLLLNETVNQSLDDYVAQQLGASSFNESLYDVNTLQTIDETSFENVREQARQQSRREGIKRLLQDGALLAISQRALIGKFLSLKLLGVGGLAVAAAVLAPKAMNAYRNYFQPQFGTLQGAPLSPLLTNAYMTPFDSALTNEGWRLIRYCDDFVVQCRSEEESQAALISAEKALANRRLQMHTEKTRIIAPNEEFEFLGYIFAKDGRVIPPPSVPEQMAQQIKMMARRAMRWRKR